MTTSLAATWQSDNAQREIVATLRLAERYLAHPDVQAIPFALPASVPLERIRAVLAEIDKEVTR